MDNDDSSPSHSHDDPLEPSGIAQFVEHDRCPRYLKQRVDPGEEPNARDWREAFGLMNIALLGKGQEFEAAQIEALAANATKVIAPELNDQPTTGVPDIPVDETWADSPRGRTAQLAAAIDHAAGLNTPNDNAPYILLYQAPLNGILGEESIYGDADCIALAPGDALPVTEDTAPTVVARVIDCKSAQDEQPAHRVQVAAYCALLEQTLAEGPCDHTVRIEASVLTQTHATADQPQSPFDLPTFRREEWELFVTQLLEEDGPVADALTDDLQDLPFALDQVCNNCAYREACAARAVENPRQSQSLAMLGLNASTQRTLQDTGLTSLHDIATLAPPQQDTTPMDDPPRLEIDADLRRSLEETLPYPIYELVMRAQALYSTIEPDYPVAYKYPPAIPGNDWVPLPDDRCAGWSNIESADPGELIHVALFVRPDSAINRIGALGACITADEHDEYITIGEVIDAAPDDDSLAADCEEALFERFLTALFEAIEQVATALGEPEQAVMHCYTYSEHELDSLTEGLDRHRDSLTSARALRALCSLDEDGHTDVDQSMVTPVQPVINDHFALQSPSQGLLSVVDQFDASWTIDTFDPPDARPSDPPLREIFDEQFLSDAVPYLDDDPGIRLHLGRGPLAEGSAADVVDADHPDPDGWYRIRKRSGGQFPLEYIWAAVPKRPGDDQPRLHPAVVDEWAVDDEHRALYQQEIRRFYHRTNEGDEALQRRDVTALVERLSYSLQRLVEAIPYKDAYHPKEPIDATELLDFEPPVTALSGAARDYLRMEFGASRETTIDQYRSSLRERARSGRSMPIRCTDYTLVDDGTLTITADLAYEELFEEPATAKQVAQQARLRSTDGTSGGSWRVLTPLTQSTPNCEFSTAATTLEATVDDPEDTKHSPPVLVDHLDLEAGTIVLTALPHRFRKHGSRFRVDHCGWTCPAGSNLTDPDVPPTDRDGYVSDRPPVRVDTGELFMLDPMVDDFGAPKADRALRPETIQHNPLWQQTQTVHRQDHQPQRTPQIGTPEAIERFCEQMQASDACLTPNDAQRRFIEAVDRPLVPLQGPPGTGKTSGATAPALLARAYAHAQHDQSFTGFVVAPSHEAVDAVLGGVVECLDNWRADTSVLADLDLVRVTPTPPPADTLRADASTSRVDVAYAAYHSDTGAETLAELAQAMTAKEPTQRLLFATPATLYRVLGIVAETCSAIDGTSAPAAMRYAPGLADVVCLDEASMLDLPRLFLATSALKPAGQTLLVGDHRQLATVSEVDWTATRRRPVAETGAYRSALDYVRKLAATTVSQPTATDGGSRQSALSQFIATEDSTSTGGDR